VGFDLETMRTLAIDYGTVRVGLAMSDEGARFATPHDVLTVSSPGQAMDQVLQIITKEHVVRLLLGVPINMDDSIGPMARKTIEWGQSLAGRSGKPIVFVDERLSSFAAEQDLNERKRGGERITRKRRKEQLDALAAAGFLQAFLDGKLPALDVPM
jgi:putative Holliday junction resolvase